MPFKVPERHYKVLEQLLGKSVEELQEIVAALEEAKPSLLPEGLAPHLSAKANIDPETSEDIINFLVSIFVSKARNRLDESEFLDEICKAIGLVGKSSLKPENDDWNSFKVFLSNALALEASIGVTSKALDVMLSHERCFCRSRIISDLRPIFKSDPEEFPVASVVVHTLELTYHPAADISRLEKFFVAMDSGDLKELKDVIDRAISKQDSMQVISEKSNIPCLSVEGDE